MTQHHSAAPLAALSTHLEKTPLAVALTAKSGYNCNNPLFAKDAYKTQHLRQYPDGTEYIYSNLTARSSVHFPVEAFDGKVVVAGLQGFVAEILQDYWNDEFFAKDADEVILPYMAMVKSALGEGAVTSDHLYALHKLGYLPLRVKAMPEGSRVDLRIPLMTVVNTLPEFAWLTNFLETIWSNYTWKPITVATIAYQYRQLMAHYAHLTGAPMDFVKFQGHDFSARGMAGNLDSRTAGLGHLFSFVGSDTLEAGQFACEYYGADWDKELILAAPAATEHAVMCANYAIHGELETYRRLITQIYPTGMVAIVSDTIDFWNVLTHVATELKDEILARPGNDAGPGKVVFRPDSGEPEKILCGDNEWPIYEYASSNTTDEQLHAYIAGACFNHYFAAEYYLFELPQVRKITVLDIDTGHMSYHKVTFEPGNYGKHHSSRLPSKEPRNAQIELFDPTPAQKGALQVLWEGFGGTRNDEGYRVLNPAVGLVYGDSITLERCERILRRMTWQGFASSNVVFGIGSFTYQYLTRDTFGLAIKATWAQINGQGYDLQKKPATDSGIKHSAKGRLRVERDEYDLHYVVHEEQDDAGEAGGELRVIFENGVLHNQDTLADIRERLWKTTQTDFDLSKWDEFDIAASYAK